MFTFYQFIWKHHSHLHTNKVNVATNCCYEVRWHKYASKDDQQAVMSDYEHLVTVADCFLRLRELIPVAWWPAWLQSSAWTTVLLHFAQRRLNLAETNLGSCWKLCGEPNQNTHQERKIKIKKKQSSHGKILNIKTMQPDTWQIWGIKHIVSWRHNSVFPACWTPAKGQIIIIIINILHLVS